MSLDTCKFEPVIAQLALGRAQEPESETRGALHEVAEYLIEEQYFQPAGMAFSTLEEDPCVVIEETFSRSHSFTAWTRLGVPTQAALCHAWIGSAITERAIGLLAEHITTTIGLAFTSFEFERQKEQSVRSLFQTKHFLSTVEHIVPSLANYEYVFDRIEAFRKEELDWDGYGGRPASSQVCEDVCNFLHVAQRQSIKEPDLALGNDGSVAVVWENDDCYIAVDFSSDGFFVYVVIEDGQVTAQGDHHGGVVPLELLSNLTKHFMDDC